MSQAQLLKGILEGIVLALIGKKETYGYELIDNLSRYGFDNISEGTLYPILSRLENSNYICCKKIKSPYGPIRKYYFITSEGKDYLLSFKEDYLELIKKTNTVLEDL